MVNVRSTEGATPAAVQIESETAIAGLAAGIVGAAVGLVALWGRTMPLWSNQGWSIGAIAAITVGVLGLVVAFVAYWRSRFQSGQEWRLDIPSWKFILDACAVALVHAAIATLLSVAVFGLLQRSFEGLVVDQFTSLIGVGLAAGLACYWIAVSCGSITTLRMSSLLVVFMAISVFAVMLTTTDPDWWKYNFSMLGSLGGAPSVVFNVSLMAAGALVTVFAVYLYRDLTLLHEVGVLKRASTPRIVMVLFVIMGVLLAGVGIVPVALSEPTHIAIAAGMFATFVGMLIASPRLFAGMPRVMHLGTGLFLAALLISVVLYFPIQYFNLTAMELVAFGLIFGWIVAFIRFENATIQNARETAQGREASRGL